MANIINNGKFRARDDNGAPLSGGKLYTYLAGSAGATPKATYTTSKLTVANTNPVILDSAGRADVWVGNGSYLLVLKDADENLIWSVDNYRDKDDANVNYSYTKAQLVFLANYSSRTIDLSKNPFGLTSFDGVAVYINGVLQQPSVAFTVAGSLLTLAEDIESDDLITILVAGVEPTPVSQIALEKKTATYTVPDAAVSVGIASTVIDLSVAAITYETAKNQILLFVNGAYQSVLSGAVTESSTTTITINEVLVNGDVVDVFKIV